MSRSRKHVTLGVGGDVEPPGPGQAIVRALGSRGSNIIEVEFPDGRQTLVFMPAKFNKKLWVKRGGFLLIEDSMGLAAAGAAAQGQGQAAAAGAAGAEEGPGAAAAVGGGGGAPKVTGTILAVLYDDQIKQLMRLPGVWPAEFSGKGDKGSLEDMMPPSGSDSEAEEGDGVGGAAVAAAVRQGCEGGDEGEEEDEDDGLPPLQQNNNRKIVYHEVSSESDDDDD